MTKKHFKVIADLLNNANRAVVDEHGHPQAADIVMADLCHALAATFAAENPRFDRAKFLTACGL